jgi:hypothetical protein
MIYARTPPTVNGHCNENPIYVFPEKELRGLNPNFQIQVSVNDLCIPRIGPHILLHQNRQTDCGNILYKSLTYTCMLVGTKPSNSFSGNICFEFSVLCLCSGVAWNVEIM